MKIKIKLITLLFISCIVTSCSKDDATNDMSETSTNKTPKYTNGLFFTTSGISTISSKINFVSLKDNSVAEVYNSTTNHTVGIDGDDSFYYLLNNKLDDQGASSILVKDIETFNDITTIANNVANPIKVISYKDDIFVVNSNNEDFFNVKPFISVFSKNQFPFKRKINLPEKTKIEVIKAHENKVFMTLSPMNLGELKESLVILDLDNFTINELRLTTNTYDIQDIAVYKNEVYVSVSPSLSILNSSEREVYKLNTTTLDLVYKIKEEHFAIDGSKIAAFEDDFYTSSSSVIYKYKPGSTELENTFDNNDVIRFLHFISNDEFLVVSDEKLKIKNIKATASSRDLVEVPDPFTTTIFVE